MEQLVVPALLSAGVIGLTVVYLYWRSMRHCLNFADYLGNNFNSGKNVETQTTPELVKTLVNLLSTDNTQKDDAKLQTQPEEQPSNTEAKKSSSSSSSQEPHGEANLQPESDSESKSGSGSGSEPELDLPLAPEVEEPKKNTARPSLADVFAAGGLTVLEPIAPSKEPESSSSVSSSRSSSRSSSSSEGSEDSASDLSKLAREASLDTESGDGSYSDSDSSNSSSSSSGSDSGSSSVGFVLPSSRLTLTG
ncbi:hypothetical protein M1146_06525 [Patescibacteria group bacterium]|nr:hypothetical protein [Patescibacteria group bacterium]